MTMEEVNERFPLTKYKQWMTNRAAEGLPTAGGINTASSRPATLHNVEGVSKEIDEREKSTDATSSAAIRPILTATDTAVTDPNDAQHGSPEVMDDPTTPRDYMGAPEVRASSDRPSTAKSAVTHADTATKTETNDEAEGEDEEDQIQTAVPTEQLPDPGDSCAICLDTIDEDDDIRGLTCGHAFHASCVDPWLTSRRACCPLCKADYYVPKPRAEGADAESATGRRMRGANMPAAPQYAFMGAGRGGVNPFGGRRPSMVLPGRFMTIVYNENDRYGFPTVVREPRPSRAERRAAMRRASSVAFDTDAETAAADAIAQARNQQQNAPPPWRQRLFGNLRLPHSHTERRNEGQQENGTTGPSPAQLEAGTG